MTSTSSGNFEKLENNSYPKFEDERLYFLYFF